MGSDVWAVIGTVSFWGWVVAFLTGIFRTFPARGVFRQQQALFWGALVVVSGAFWVVSLLTAS